MTQRFEPLCNQIQYEQVQTIVHHFYKKLIAHPQLSHFFSHIDDFTRHEKRITDFWWQAMGGKLNEPLDLDMIGKHTPLGIQTNDLKLWLKIFEQTLNENLDHNLTKQWMIKTNMIAKRIEDIVIKGQSMGVQIGESK